MEQLLADDVIESARKVAEQAEVFCVSSRETPVHFEANSLKQVQTRESDSIALRIIREGRVGFAAASGPWLSDSSVAGRDGEVASLIDMAVATSRLGNPARFEFPGPGKHPPVNVFDPRVEEMPVEEMIELGHRLIARITEHAPRILCDGEVTRGSGSVRIVNSRGGEASYEKSFFHISVEGVLIEGTDMLFVGDSESSCRVPEGVDVVADRVIRQLKMAEGKATVSSKRLPVVFTPNGVASALLSPIVLAFNGRTVVEGSSPLAGRRDEQVFDVGLSLWDDATLDLSVGSCPCDDEGVSSRRLPLIGDGVVSGFLHDLNTAALAGVESTGSGRRASGMGQVKPATSGLVIREGDVAFHSMVEEMKEGLIVEHVMGADQGNLFAGDFGGNVLLGYKVENGKIVGRVKDTMISGNIYQALQQGLGIGREARWAAGVLWTPHLYCPRLSVSAK